MRKTIGQDNGQPGHFGIKYQNLTNCSRDITTKLKGQVTINVGTQFPVFSYRVKKGLTNTSNYPVHMPVSKPNEEMD